MAILTSNELRNGTVFMMDGQPWVVIRFEHIKMGRGSATNKVKARNLRTGAIIERGFQTNVKFDEAEVNKNTGQYLYSSDDTAYFMNPETFEQLEIPLSICAEQILYLKEGDKAVIVSLGDEVISLELPKSVELKVVYTEPGVRGNTATNALKSAEMETGLKIMVPLFIEIGDVLKINTENGTYTERAKS